MPQEKKARPPRTERVEGAIVKEGNKVFRVDPTTRRELTFDCLKKQYDRGAAMMAEAETARAEHWPDESFDNE